MTTPELQRGAAAIAEVRERYIFETNPRDTVGKYCIWMKDSSARYVPFDREPIFDGTRDQCQAWIDIEAARACVLAMLPVSDGAVDAACEGFHRTNLPTIFQSIQGALVSFLNHIAGRSE